MFRLRLVHFGANIYFNTYRYHSSTFVRRCLFSLKTVLTLIISGLIAYQTSLRDHFDQQYIICVISVLSIQETIGSTLSSNYQTIVSIVPLSIVLYLIHLIGLSYGQYLAAEFLLLLLSFLITYQCTQVKVDHCTFLALKSFKFICRFKREKSFYFTMPYFFPRLSINQIYQFYLFLFFWKFF